MIDISFDHSKRAVSVFDPISAEHFGYLDELDTLDFKKKEDFFYAINKWGFIDPYRQYGNIEVGSFCVKEVCRFCMTLNICLGDFDFPGVGPDVALYDELGKEKFFSIYHKELYDFQLMMWDVLFPDEKFTPAELDQYRQRTDFEFRNFPYFPERWKEPEYEPWPWEKLIAWNPKTNDGVWNYNIK